MSPYDAVQKCFADIESQYDEKVGFELKLENLESEIQENELRGAAAIQNKSYGFDWGPFASLISGVDTQHRHVKAGDKFQRIHQAAATESQQQSKSKGDNATCPGNVVESQATNSNVAPTATSNTKNNNFAHSEEDNEQQEQDELYKDTQQLQQRYQPNNASKNNNNNSHQ